MRPLNFALWLALGWVGLAVPALAEQEQQVVGLAQQGRILSDPEAPEDQRPTVISAPNGVPLVNITTPSEAGVSRNLYSQFDVGGDGAVLNNSRGETRTQLGGWVQGNPWLATGTAKVILNEVNSADPSRLNGYIEVAGDRAEVVIANPSGIQVNGAGFINTPRVTLTTGRPVLRGGALDHYRVERGTIRVEGAGLDTSRVNYTDIMARALEVHGGIWANELRTTLGTNHIGADHAGVTATDASTASGAGPEFALDVGALGGMYANKIWLVGNEQGLGARNAGNIGAGAGGLVVTVDGRLENTGTLQSKSDSEIRAGGELSNAGTLSAARELNLSTAADIDNSGGTLNGRRLDLSAEALRNRDGAIEQTGTQDLVLDSGALSNRDGGRIGLSQPLTGDGDGEAGGGTPPGNGPAPEDGANPDSGDTGGDTAPPTESTPLADGLVEIAGTLDNDGGRISAGGATDVKVVDGLDNSGGHLGARHLAQEGGDLSNRDGELVVTDSVQIEAAEIANDGGRVSFQSSLTFEAEYFSNRGGTLAHSDAGDIALHITGTFDNSGGALETNAATLAIDSQTLVNEQGRITHAGTDGLTLQADTFNGADGRIATAGEVQLTIGDADHRGAALEASGIALDAADFDNRGGTLIASGEQGNTLAVTGTLDNGTHNEQGGRIVSNGDLQIRAGAFGNVEQAGTGSLKIDAASLEGSGGTIVSNGSLTVTGDTIDLSGGTTSAERIAIDTGNLSTAEGSLIATSEETLQLQVVGTLNNDGGTIAGNGAFDLSAGELGNRMGTLQAAGPESGEIKVRGNFDNSDGILAAAGDTSISARNFVNTGGTLQTADESSLQLTVEDLLDNSGAGLIAAGGELQLAAATLDNREGTINIGDNLDIVVQSLQNNSGALVGKGDLTLRAHTLSNREDGILVSVDNSIDLSIAGYTDNRGGRIQATEGLTLASAGLDNTGGGILGGNIAIDTRGQNLENSGGTIATDSGGLNIHSGALTNDGGLLQSADDLQLDTAGETLVNTNAGDSGGLLSGGRQTLAIGNLDNRAGLVHAGGALTARSGDLDNRNGGQFGGSDNVTLQGAELHNRGGVLHAGGDLDAQLTGTARNNAGLISAGNTLDLTAAVIDNRNTRGETPLGLQGDSIDLSAGRSENRNGLIAADTRIDITGSQLDNSSGEVSSAGILGVVIDAVTNTGGTLYSGEAQTINTDSLSGDGSLLSQGDLTLTLAQGFTLTGEITANQTADITINGWFTNESKGLQAGDLTLNATSIDNTAGAEISGGQVRLNADDTLTNRGLIDGGNTRIDADTLENLGSGRIYGDHIAIEADTLQNLEETLDGETKAAVIAARQRLDIAAGTLLNREDALIFSAGQGAYALNIGGRLDENGYANGSAASVHNASATIESQGGLTIDAASLLNSNEHFATREAQIGGPTDIIYTQIKGYPNKYTDTELFEQGWTFEYWKDGVSTWFRPDGDRREDWTEYNVTRTEYRTQVTESAPAVISSGGDMTLRGGELVNDKSHILAGGAIRGDLQNLDNIDAKGEHRVHEEGTSRETWVKLTGWDDDPKRKWGDPILYLPGDEVETIDLDVVKKEENQNGGGSGYEIESRNTDTAGRGTRRDTADNSAESREVESKVVRVAETTAPQDEQGLDAAASTGPAPEEVHTVGADTAIPRNSLFRVQPENGDYLIETDPRFANYRDWLSSDYLLDALDHDQDLIHKRLGDGFYEQTLVREQIAQLTGRRFLADYTSDEDQYRALLEAGATVAEAWDLRPGVALTAEQMAQLTSDIVWLVEETVTLPDGNTTTALVPQVYVRARPGDLDGEGTLISGENVHFNLEQDLANTGDIAGRNAVQITAENLRNLDGRITGDRVSLHARTDLDNIGGTIDAENGLAVSAGRDITIATTTRSDNNRAGLSDYSRTNIDRVAGLYVSKGNLVATAGRDFVIRGAEIANSGDGITQVSAERDLTLATVETHNQENMVGGDNFHLKQGHTEEVGSSIQGGGQVVLNSGGDTSLRGAEVNAGGDMGLISGGDLLIESATNTRNYDYYHKEEAGSSLSSDKTTAIQHNTEDVVGSHISAGGDVAMVAEGDLAILGSQVEAEQDIALDGRDITIAASEQKESHYQTSSKSGPLGSESAGQASEQLSLATAELKSAGGDISLDAARNITIAASNLETASGDINLTAVDDLLIAAGEVMETTSNWSEDSGYFTGGDFYAAEQRAGTTETTRAQGSNISAGGNLNIDSGRAKVVGSDLTAGNDLNIETDIGDIEILAARETSHSTHSEEETRVSLGDVASSLSNPDELVQSEDGQLKIKLADAEYHAVDSESAEVSHRGSNLTADNDISLDAIGDLTVEGSNLVADSDDSGAGDIVLSGENVIIKEAKDSLHTSSEETSGSAELNVVVQHQAVEVAKAAKALDEAADNLKQAKEDYRKYQKDLKNLKGTLSQLEADYENGTPGVSQADIVELKQLIDDAESDKEWYQAGIAAAAADVTSKTTALMQQSAAAAQSAGTYGFNAGVQLDVDATRTGSESHQTSSQASNLSGQNISIQTGNEDGTSDGSTQIRGSHLQADDRIAIDTGELDIEASRDTASQRTQTEHGNISIQQTVYGAAGGPTVSGSLDRSQSRNRQTTYNNSTLSVDQIALNSSGDTTLAGANVHADSQLDVAVGGDLTVESRQNRASGSNNSAGISGGFGTSGGDNSGLTSVNGGANSANGRYRNKETVLTSLTSGGEANIDVGEHTQITGALVATVNDEGKDLGNLNLSTETLDYADLSNTDYSSQQSAGISTSVGFNGAKPADPAQQNATDATGDDDLRLNTSNVQYNNESHYSKDKTLATVGQGNITVRDESSDKNGDLAGLNRDVESTEKELFEVDRQEGNVDVAVDHRLLSKKGWEEISQDAEVLEEAAAVGADYLESVVVSLPEKLANQTGPLGEGMHDTLIRQGYDPEEAQALLSDPAFQQYVVETANQLTEEIESAEPQLLEDLARGKGLNLAATDEYTQGPDGEIEYVEVTSVRDQPLPGKLNDGLATANDYLNTLDPATRDMAMLAAGAALGGPVKQVAGVVIDEMINAAAGEEIEQATNKVAEGVTEWAIGERQEDGTQADNEDYDRAVDGTKLGVSIATGIGLPGRKTSNRQSHGNESGGNSGGGSEGSSGNNTRKTEDADETPDWDTQQSRAGEEFDTPEQEVVSGSNVINGDSVTHVSGVELSRSQSQMISDFEASGYPSTEVVSPTSGKVIGNQYILPDGSRVRVMQPDGRNPRRASFENENGGPIDPATGKPPQPPKGLSRAERKQWIRERTHIVQED
ncbi:hemagglutinin repeat-containing protein [Microbulbifer halophilus]|uniref:Hemagglutinin repeat-containing protein n=1 Tax=Microbulbifer halophilus TaxID=453963 RepID=A0ABW5ECR1_9GAMM|nr:hemagglutinin repeat-containing protein [Microbulbifer halophilus]MCW8125936.1 hemagglutinin repeat-containing protein [Microbulbifer halophilus]